MTDPTPERLDTASLDIAAEKVARLREDFPEVFEDGRINFEALKRSLGDWVDPGKERFGLTWPGKAACMRTIQQPSYGTLRPDRAESVDFDTTQNVIIEGENLEVLKLLQKSYYGKVKMIYIDPPYNTGQDFVYPDDFREPLANYLRLTGQIGEGRTRLSTNTETEGRFHTNWLNMMYPRLFLARNLLKSDGVVFVSIDDNELENLRLVLNEVFGESNFVAQIIWRKRSSPPNDQVIGANHDYIVCYAKESETLSINLRKRSDEQEARYKNPDNHPKGPWAPGDLMANVKGGRYVSSLHFPIRNPNTGEDHYPSSNGNWRFSHTRVQQLLDNDEIYFGVDGRGRPKLKRFLGEVKEGMTYSTIWDFVPLNTQGTAEMARLLDDPTAFESPKPVGLLEELIRLGSKNNEIVLDFFAGSGTTAHAVMKQNSADGGNRRYILVQLPEPTEGEYPTISAITRKRVRRAGAAIAAERDGQLALDGAGPLDLGFRAYHLAESNLYITPPSDVGLPGAPAERASQPALFADTSRTPSPVQIELFADNIRPGRSDDDLLTQILLSTGYELTEPVERLALGGVDVYSVAEGDLLVCLSRSLTMDVIEAMAEREPAQIICLDVGFGGNDALKVNAVQAIKARGKSQFRVL